MSGPNIFHRIGDALSCLSVRLARAYEALTGPLMTPLERTSIMTIFLRLEALEAAQAAQAAINANVSAATDAATKASSDVASLTDRVTAIETEVGTEAPASGDQSEQAQG